MGATGNEERRFSGASEPLGPVTLVGGSVRLVPVREVSTEDLVEAAAEPAIWRWMPTRLDSMEAMRRFLAEAAEDERLGTRFVFAVLDAAEGRVLGSTSYLKVEAAHRKLEIGWTWYRPDAWATRVNPEAKLLLLQHAFEGWGALRVQFLMDTENLRSAAAVRKLGAQLEGRLRNDRIRPDGTLRDSFVYSILDTEWPAVKLQLQERITQGADGG